MFEPRTLRVVGKPLKYGTRMMQPGDTFEARKRSDEAVFLVSKRAVVSLHNDEPKAVQAKPVEKPAEPSKPRKTRRKAAKK